MVGFFIVHRDPVERVFNQQAVAGESLEQTGRVVISHHGYFIRRLQTFDCFTRSAMDLVAKWIQTAAPINQKQDRQRQTVLTEVSYLLLRAIFIEQKILLLQSANDARRVLLQDERVDGDEVNINLD